MKYLCLLVLICSIGCGESEATKVSLSHGLQVQEWDPPVDGFFPKVKIGKVADYLPYAMNIARMQGSLAMNFDDSRVSIDMGNGTAWTEAGKTFLEMLSPGTYPITLSNATVVGGSFTNVPSALLTLVNVRYITDTVSVGEDEKLPIKYQALTTGGNPGTLTNITWTVSDPSKAAFVAAQQPQGGVVGHLVPVGPMGTVRLTMTGTNSKGVIKSGFLDVQIVPGAVDVIIVESLTPVPK